MCPCLFEGSLRRRISCDEVMPLWWSHSGTSVSLTVQLPLHKEIALLFEVDVTIGAHKATRVMIFIPRFHHCPAVAETTDQDRDVSDVYNFDVRSLKYFKHAKILNWQKTEIILFFLKNNIRNVLCCTFNHTQQWCHSAQTNPGAQIYVTAARWEFKSQEDNKKQTLSC